ncbi:MAG TPA: hypothetical protein VF691_05090 [Cytophagaceae bacterium]|jgi:hypothetical protein
MKRQLKLFSFILFLFASPCLRGFCVELTYRKDTSNTVKDTVHYTYYAAFNHVSNLVFFGRSGEERTPYVSSDVYMQIPAGFWTNISLLSFYSLHSITQIDNIGITLGYDRKLSKKLAISTSLNRFFYPSTNVSIQNAATNLVDLYLGYKSGYLKSSVGCSYMSGSASDFFTNLNVSGYFENNYIFNSNFSLLFEPKFAVNTGSQNFVSIYQEEKSTTPTTGSKRPVRGGKGNKNTSNTSTSPLANEHYIDKSQFNILSYEVGFPITVSFKSLSLEASYNYIIPVNLLEGDTSVRRSIFSTSLYFTFSKQKIRYRRPATKRE